MGTNIPKKRRKTTRYVRKTKRVYRYKVTLVQVMTDSIFVEGRTAKEVKEKAWEKLSTIKVKHFKLVLEKFLPYHTARRIKMKGDE